MLFVFLLDADDVDGGLFVPLQGVIVLIAYFNSGSGVPQAHTMDTLFLFH
jgi:hypothetical protein